MRIICANQAEQEIAKELSTIALSMGCNPDIVARGDAFALTIWSVDDLSAMRDVRIASMTSAEKIDFMEFSEKQLKTDMTERGWASLDILLDEYFSMRIPSDITLR